MKMSSFTEHESSHRAVWKRARWIRRVRRVTAVRRSLYRHVILLGLTACLLLISVLMWNGQPAVLAANPGAGNACAWYTIRYGDTLAILAARDHTTIRTLARVNNIRNINLIFAGNQLCVPYHAGAANQGYAQRAWSGGGLAGGGRVSWYNYGALEWSTPTQVASMLRQAAAQFGLPASLLLAIAWQESGWTQHVISRDGGIGVMQVMPYTAQDINASTRLTRNPYHLWDNVMLGATYLSWLWRSFGGNLARVISAYNEGGWAVTHRGIFNWSYVNNVMYLMRVLH